MKVETKASSYQANTRSRPRLSRNSSRPRRWFWTWDLERWDRDIFNIFQITAQLLLLLTFGS